MNIPARYATGYLGDIGVAPDPNPMDFSAWFDVFLQGQWYTFDARHNRRRIGRVLIGLGRDAADVPITMAFGKESLEGFRVLTEEIVDSLRSPTPLPPRQPGRHQIATRSIRELLLRVVNVSNGCTGPGVAQCQSFPPSRDHPLRTLSQVISESPDSRLKRFERHIYTRTPIENWKANFRFNQHKLPQGF
jgi:hypothetical protein